MILRILSFLLFFFGSGTLAEAQVQQSRTAKLMGSIFEITIVDTDSITAQKHIDMALNEIERIENLISEWRPHTQISEINQKAGIGPVRVNQEVFELTQRAINFSKLSKGAFDISVIATDKIWFFDGTMTEMPSKEALKKSIQNVGYQYIALDQKQQTIFLTRKGMKIGFGATGKGYAADKARKLLQDLGVKSGIVNASGDIASWGIQIDGAPWKIGIEDPFESGSMLKVLEFSGNKAVATSGSYRKFAEIGGTYYSHIINPKTGIPASGIISVTIIGTNTEFCNGLSTSVMVLGVKKGIKLLKKFPELDYLIITDRGQVFSKS